MRPFDHLNLADGEGKVRQSLRTVHILRTRIQEMERVCGPLQRARTHCTETAARYGPAFLVTTGTLSLVCFWLIYLMLITGGFDARSLLERWRASLNPTVFTLLEKSGPFAVAFALNRVVSPVRYCVSIALLPYTAPRINHALDAYIRPWCARTCPACVVNYRCCCSAHEQDGAHEQDDAAERVAMVVPVDEQAMAPDHEALEMSPLIMQLQGDSDHTSSTLSNSGNNCNTAATPATVDAETKRK